MEKVFEMYRKNKGFLLFIFVFVSMRWSFADHYRVPSGSMLPTIHIGDHVFVNKMAYDLRLPFTNFVILKTGEPKRGEIIVFDFPKDPNTKFVKRLAGIPGDIIEMNQGVLKINGVPAGFSPDQKSLRMVVPPNQYFVLGDNRDNSHDSRFWGFVPREKVRGEVTGTSISVSFDNFIPKFNFDRFAKKLI